MRAHVALEVKIRKFFVLFELEEFAELAVGENATTVFRVLKRVFADVRVNFAGHLSAGHFGSLGLVEEGRKFRADERRLDKATRGAVASLALALLASFLGSTKFAVRALLESTEARRERGKLRAERRKISHKSVERIVNRGFRRFFDNFGGSFSRRSRRGGLGRFGFRGGLFYHLILYYHKTFLSVF